MKDGERLKLDNFKPIVYNRWTLKSMERPAASSFIELAKKYSKRTAAGVVLVGAAAITSCGNGDRENEITTPNTTVTVNSERMSEVESSTWNDLVASTLATYAQAKVNLPEKFPLRILNCGEMNLTAENDPVRYVIDSCGVLAKAAGDLYVETGNNKFLELVEKFEAFTNRKIDKFLAEGMFPDPQNIQSYRDGLKDIYFTPRSSK